MSEQVRRSTHQPGEELEALRARVELLERVLAELPQRIEAERDLPEVAEQDVERAAARVQELSGEIQREKAKAARHKREVHAWTAAHAGPAGVDHSTWAASISHEAHWRGAAIAKIEQRIAAIEDEKLAAIQEHARLVERRGARKSAEDPRIESCRRELESARNALRAARPPN